MAVCGADDGAGCGHSHWVHSGDQSNGPLAVERHDLFDAVPVGFGQRETAGSGSRVVAHHAQPGLRRVAVGFGGHPVLSGIQQPPVITTDS